LNGSYNFTNNEFIGSLSTPAIDTYSRHPGSGWELINTPPSKSELRLIKSVCIKTGGNVKEALLENLGPKIVTLEELK
jgi:hypothetical protein